MHDVLFFANDSKVFLLFLNVEEAEVKLVTNISSLQKWKT